MNRSLLLFALAGLASAGAYFATLYVLEYRLGVDYRLAVTAAYTVSVAAHFLLNRHLTFAGTAAGNLRSQLARYPVLVVLNYLISIAVVVACVEWLGLNSAQGVLLSMPVTLAAGYLLARKWVFQSRNRQD